MSRSVTAIVDTPEEAAALELPPLLVRRPLEAYLDAHGLGAGAGRGGARRRGPLQRHLPDPPRRDRARAAPPAAPAAAALRARRAARGAAARARSRAPTCAPRRCCSTCDDESVIGAPFYVMERCVGDVIVTRAARPRSTTRTSAAASPRSSSTRWSRSTRSTGRRAGSSDYGKPTGYLDRQLRRFGGLWEHNKTRELPVLDDLTQWLGEHKPESGPATIVHGDYRLGNVMFARGTPPRLNAIFDWELATIGDPLADVGYLVATWAQPGDPESPISALGGLTRRPGFLTRDELIARYEAALRALDVRRALVHDAGAVEVGGLPRGLLQAAAGRHDRGRVLRPARAGRARRRRARVADRAGRR